ncbi:T9SS type B sorting domain-containing protein [Candidatus Marifrigoribacter sp. Uisw_064]|uniref:T9SS type B sorting domain-containing protein n=1 Tax=Candidatus Marifrigoribacter sp. Uisw_064 TaxID=3230970 RepID=UPI003D589F44
MKKYYPLSLLVILLVMLLPQSKSYSQGPGSLFVDAGADIVIPCASGGCADITASYLEIFETFSTNYTVGSIPYNPPFPFSGLANSVNTSIDDAWNNPEPLPFDFCFFGNLETQFQVGSNGVIRFEVNAGDTTNGWQFSENLPNNTNPTLSEANIFTPVHDIDPSASTTNEIAWEILGTYPNRVLVVSYFDVPLYVCNSQTATHMAVFYEFSNVIEIYIQDKPTCSSWNSGNAAVGIQNNAGNLAYVPPGRNTSDSPWTTSNEAWSFAPAGVETFVFEWLDSTGTVIGTSDTINVCPSGGSEIFTARVTYTNTCNGDIVILTDDVLVTEDSPFIFDLGPDVTDCEGGADILLDADQGDPTFTYQWFLDAVAIAGATNPTYLVTSPNSGTYSIEVIDPTDPSCLGIDSVIITFLPFPVVENPPIDLSICDNGAAPGIFDLTVNTPIVLGGQNPADFNVSYHNSQIDADTNTAPIATPAAYLITGTNETIYIRIEDLTGVCIVTANFDIIFNPAIAGVITPNPYILCDPDESGDEEIDLSAVFDAQVLNGQNPLEYIITYHSSQADADTGIGALVSPYTVTAPSETIYVRFERVDDGSCFDSTQNVLIEVNLFTVDLGPDVTACEGGGDILLDADQGDPLITYQWFLDAVAIAGATNPTYLVVSPNSGTYSVEVTDGACVVLDDIIITFLPSPVVENPPIDLSICDNGAAPGIFDLTVNTPIVLGGQNPADFNVSYHNSQIDADTNTAPIATPAAYLITGTNETIYIRIEDLTGVCIVTANFDIIFNPAIAGVITPNPYILCDSDESGDEEIDLSAVFDAQVLNGQNPLEYIITYHSSQADADTGIGALVSPYTVTAPSETIYVRFERVDDGSCFDSTQNVLIEVNLFTVDLGPDVTDCEGGGDILLDADQGDPLITYQWFLDAVAIAGATNPTYLVVSPNSGTYSVEVTDGACVVLDDIIITFLPFPVVENPPIDLSICDNGAAPGIFDLTVNTPIVLGGQNPADFNVSYHNSQIDADTNTAPIATPAAYLITGTNETIYIRIEDLTGVCIVTANFDIIFNPAIAGVITPNPYILCDPDESGDEEIDLSAVFDAQVLNGQNPLEYIITYHSSQADADTGIGALVSPYTVTAPSETIYVRFERVDDGSCFDSTQNVLIEVNLFTVDLGPDVTDCEGGGDILLDADQGDPLITYQWFLDAVAIAGATNPTYLVVSPNSGTYSVEVTDGACVVLDDIIITFLPFPVVENPPIDLSICDNGAAPGIFDLTVNTPIVLGGQNPADFNVSYHNSQIDADTNTAPIATPAAYLITGTNETIYIRIEDLTGVCIVTANFDIIFNPAIAGVITPNPYILCDPDESGDEEIDLSAVFDAQVLNGQNPLEYIITYHSSQADADTGIGALVSPYTVTAPSETIYVRFERVDDGSCFDSTQNVLIEVNLFTVDLGPDVTACEGGGDILLDADQGDPLITYQWFLDAVAIAGATNPTYLVVSPNSGTYSVEVTDGACVVLDDIIITFLPSPVVENPPIDLSICDNGAAPGIFDLTVNTPIVLGGQNPADFNVSYHNSQIDADTNTAPIATPAAYLITGTNETIYIRIEDLTGVCIVTANFDIIFNPAIAGVITPNPYILCDSDESGDEEIDLSAVFDAQVLNGQNPLEYIITYHSSQADADTGIGALVSPYTVTAPSETIYVRFERVDDGSCFDSTQNVLIEVNLFTVDLGPDVTDCEGGGDILLDADQGDPLITYQWFLDAVAIAGATNPTYLVVSPNSGTYSVEVTDGACVVLDDIIITFLPFPVVENPPIDLSICDNGAAPGIFDLTVNTPIVLGGQNPADFNVSYHNSQIDADTNTAPIATPAAYLITGTNETIYIRIEDLTGVCIVTANFDIIFNPAIAGVITPNPYILCDPDESGDEEIDLSAVFDAQVLNGQNPLEYIITYHSSQADADTGIGALVSPYTVTAPSETIYVRFERVDDGSCFDSTQNVLIEVNLFTVDLGPDVTACEGGGDILLDADQGDPLITYQWFLDAVAIAGATNPTYLVFSPNSGTYSVEVTDGACVVLDDIIITFLPSPVVENPPIDLSICDNGAAPGIFDLTVNTPIVLGGQNPADFNVSYHNSQIDADTNTAPIATPAAYLITGTNETIYIRIEDLTGVCIVTANFDIIFNPAIAGVITPNPYILCDPDATGDEEIDLSAVFDAQVLNGQNPLEYIITYHSSQADADTGIGALTSPYTVTAPSETIYVRFERVDDGSCFDSTQNVLIEVDILPISNNPLPLIECDDNNDGFFIFTLTDADLDITGGDPDLSVSYHETQLNAENNVLPLISPHANNVAYNDVVYVRVESISSGCFAVIVLELQVRNSPLIVEPAEPLRLCDVNNPGDGLEEFDLSEVEPEVLDGLDALDWDFYYYVVESDAIAAGEVAIGPLPDFSLAIVAPLNYQNQVPNAQTIYVLVVGNVSNTDPNNGGFGCYNIVPLDLIVDALPGAIEPTDRYEVCDDEIPGVSTSTDGFSSFDLTSFDAFIRGGDTTLLVTWYESPADESADNPIVTPSDYRNSLINEQTVIARVTDVLGCNVRVLLTLRVLPNPTPVTPTPLEVCDDDNDGFSLFDLSLKDTEIMGTEPDVSIAYYGNEILAREGDILNILPNPYLNDNPFNDSVWARVENNTTGCFTVIELLLVVNPLPDVPTDDFGDLSQCDDNGDGIALFDLTINTSFVIGIQDPSDFLPVTYYTSQADADLPANEILTPGAYSSGGQTIWVRIENIATECIRISTFELIVGVLPAIGPGPFTRELCDDELNGSTGTDETSTFDLTLNDIAITLGDLSLSVFYYETLADQTANNFITPGTAYQNTSTPQTLYVSVFSVEGCVIETELTLLVLPNPTPGVVAPLTACDDDNDGFAEFTLSDMDLEIIDGEPNIVVEYYGTQELAEQGDNTDVLPIPYENDDPFNDSVWARVINSVTGCYTIIELAIIVAQLPDQPTDDFGDLTECDDNGDGIAVFDLTQNTSFVIGTQDPLDFSPVTYHMSEPDAIANANAIANAINYSSSGQTIWVRIENLETGCTRITSFELIVGVMPTLGTGPFNMDNCDDLLNGSTGTDEISTFNLALNNDAITLGNTTLSVYYYETQVDQDTNNPIIPDTAYQNTSTPQTLYVSIFSAEGCEARDLLTLTVLNNPSPVAQDPFEACDEDIPDDGITEFILTDLDIDIINGEAGVVVRYYLTEAQAIIGDPIDQIVSPYINEEAFSQTIWIRATYDDIAPATGTGCYTVIPLELLVNPLPDATADVSDEIDCQLPFVGTNSIILDSKNGEVLNGQDPSIFDVLYFEDFTDAQNMLNWVSSVTPYFYDTTETPIYIGILNTVTGCYITMQDFILVVQEGASAVMPSDPYAICDDQGDNDGIATFDMQDFSANISGIDIRQEILDGQDPAIFVLKFYETLELAEAGETMTDIGDTYTNVINPQIIYARVTNTSNTTTDDIWCHAIVEVILKVEELPTIVIDGSYRLCVDVLGNPIQQEDGADSPPVIDTGLDANLYTFVWYYDSVEMFGEIGASLVALAGGEYSVTVTERATGCSNSADTLVTLSSPPLVYSAEVVSGAFAINEVIHTDSSGVTDTYTGTHVIHVTVEGLGDYVFQLDDGVFQEGDVFIDVLPGLHVVTIQDVNGCGSVEIEVSVIDYPRFVTPNQDGYHDTWNIIGIATGDPTAKIYIFDRFGKLLKQISPLGEGWDGTYNGNPLPSSDYWFRVEYTEDDIQKEFKGHFTLKR